MGAQNFPSQNPDAIADALEKRIQAFEQDTKEFIDLYPLNPTDYQGMTREEAFKAIRQSIDTMPTVDKDAKNNNLPEHLHTDYSNPDILAAQFALSLSAGPKALALPLENEPDKYACIVLMPDAHVNTMQTMADWPSPHLESMTLRHEVEAAETILDHELGHCFSDIAPVPENMKTEALYNWYMELQADAYTTASAIKHNRSDEMLDQWQAIRQTSFMRGGLSHFTAPAVADIRQAPARDFVGAETAQALYAASGEALRGGRSEDVFTKELEQTAENLLLMQRAQPINESLNTRQYTGFSPAFYGLSEKTRSFMANYAAETNKSSSYLLGFPEQTINLNPDPTPADAFAENLHETVSQLPAEKQAEHIAEQLYQLRQEERAFLQDPFNNSYDFLIRQDKTGVSNEAKLRILTELEGQLAPEKNPAPEIAPSRS